MKSAPVICVISLLCLPALGASLLTAQKFPETFQDLSFTQRMAVLSAGYEPWESQYDEKGRCISGCAYSGITIEDELDAMQRQTDLAEQYLRNAGYYVPETTDAGPIQPPVAAASVEFPALNTNPEPRCTPYNPSVPAQQKVPRGEPLLGRPAITSGYGKRTHPVTKNISIHKGMDFSAPRGTTVYAPASGTVAAIWSDDSCGNGLRISHSDGYETVYCHLDAVLLQQGESVQAGCAIAKTGNTGASTGPHLHYAIKFNDEYVDPSKYIGRTK